MTTSYKNYIQYRNLPTEGRLFERSGRFYLSTSCTTMIINMQYFTRKKLFSKIGPNLAFFDEYGEVIDLQVQKPNKVLENNTINRCYQYTSSSS